MSDQMQEMTLEQYNAEVGRQRAVTAPVGPAQPQSSDINLQDFTEVGRDSAGYPLVQIEGAAGFAPVRAYMDDEEGRRQVLVGVHPGIDAISGEKSYSTSYGLNTFKRSDGSTSGRLDSPFWKYVDTPDGLDNIAGLGIDLSKLAPEDREAFLEMASKDPSTFETIDDSVRLAATGATGGYADRFAAWANSWVGDETYDQELAFERARTDLARNRQGYDIPYVSDYIGKVAPAEIGGGALVPFGAGAKTVPQLAKVGAGYGAVAGSGYSKAETLEGRLEDTLEGAAAGAVAGPVIGKPLNAVIDKVAPKVSSWFKATGLDEDRLPDVLRNKQTVLTLEDDLSLLSKYGQSAENFSTVPSIRKAADRLRKIEARKADPLPDGGSQRLLPESGTPTTSPEARLVQAIEEAKPVRAEQEALYTQARAERIAKAEGLGAVLEGANRFEASKAQLGGALPKAQYESVADRFTQAEVDGLFNSVWDSPKFTSEYDRITAGEGLQRLLSTEGGTVPTPKQLQLLSDTFGPDLVKAVMKKRSLKDKGLGLFLEGINLPRAAMSTMDLSAPLRQGIATVGRKEFYTSLPTMFKEFKRALTSSSKQPSTSTLSPVMEDIMARPSFADMETSGLALTRQDSISLNNREEDFINTWLEKVPVTGRVTRASNAAYSGFLNKLRADMFDTLQKQLSDAGVDFKADPKALTDIAKYINSATGRGDLKADFLNRSAPVLNATLFSPRLIKSRVDLLNPVYYASLTPEVRKQAAKDMLKFGAAVTSVLTVAGLSGAEVETDPRSSSFAKIKVGNTRYDVTGGFAQYATLAARLASNQRKEADGDVKDLDGKGFNGTRGSTLLKFGRNKLAPVPAYLVNYLEGSNTIGEEFEAGPDAAKMMIPLFVQSLAEAYEEEGLTGAAKASPGLFGVGVATYKDKGSAQPEAPTTPIEAEPAAAAPLEANPAASVEAAATPLGAEADDTNAIEASTFAEGAVLSAFPRAVISSTHRGPDHELSKKNPSSDHLGFETVDVEPIEGMTFEEFIEGLEAQGFMVKKKRNETGSGKVSWATGDHWHVTIDTSAFGAK